MLKLPALHFAPPYPYMSLFLLQLFLGCSGLLRLLTLISIIRATVYPTVGGQSTFCLASFPCLFSGPCPASPTSAYSLQQQVWQTRSEEPLSFEMWLFLGCCAPDIPKGMGTATTQGHLYPSTQEKGSWGSALQVPCSSLIVLFKNRVFSHVFSDSPVTVLSHMGCIVLSHMGCTFYEE